MNKVIFIFLGLIISLYSKAQQNPTSEVAVFTLPKEAVQLNKEQAENLAHKKFRHLNIINAANQIFNIDDIIVTIRDDQKAPDENLTLEQHKVMTEDFDKRYGDKILVSKIVSINQIRFFIFEDQEDDELKLSFTSDFRNNKVINCSLRFKKADEEKAQIIFDKIIKTVRYKH